MSIILKSKTYKPFRNKTKNMEELFRFEKKNKWDRNIWRVTIIDNHTIKIEHRRIGNKAKDYNKETYIHINDGINENFKEDIKKYVEKYFEFIAKNYKNRISYAIATLIILIYREKYDTRKTIARITNRVRIFPDPSITTIRTIYKQLKKKLLNEPERVF